MPTPFPGMDPYLERPGLWEQVHTALIVEMQQYLAPRLRPKYRVDIEQRVFLDLGGTPQDDLVGMPDVVFTASGVRGAVVAEPMMQAVAPIVAELPLPTEIVQRYLEIRLAETGRVVTVLELLSPTNKRPGEGYDLYREKRLRVLGSRTHLVEIDLIRGGKPPEMRLPAGTRRDYAITISRAHQRPHADVYAFTVRDPIPDFPIPLLREDPEPPVPLNTLLHDLYDRAGYDLMVNYGKPLDVPLATDVSR